MASKKNKGARRGNAPDDERELYRKGLEGDASLGSAEHEDRRGGPTNAPHDQLDQEEGRPADSRASRHHTDLDPDASDR